MTDIAEICSCYQPKWDQAFGFPFMLIILCVYFFYISKR